MINKKSTISLLKVGQYKWIERLYKGEVSFSCVKSFVLQARFDGNDEQGDLDEAVFARVKKYDPRINDMQRLLKNDLEIIPDGEFVKMRRRSSCFIPVFCIYAISSSDFNEQIKKVGETQIRINIPEKIYNGFLGTDSAKNVLNKDFRTTSVYFQPRPFQDRLNGALLNTLSYKSKGVNYSEKGKEEFFIFPNDMREELFYKNPKYKYQHELRYILYQTHLRTCCERINISITPLDDADRHYIQDCFYMTATVNALLA